MAATMGYLNSDQVMGVLTELIQGTDLYNAETKNWKSQLCNDTILETERVLQRSKVMKAMGDDTSRPDFQRMNYQEIALAAPVRYGIASGVTQVAIDQGITEQMVRADHAEALQADKRLMIQICVDAMLQDGGWWDATATPPQWLGNAFLSTHDHYLAYSQSGIPTLANFSEIKRTIQEHGFGAGQGNIIAVINGNMAEKIENLAEWATAPGPMPTSTLDALQVFGVTPAFRAAGVVVAVNDAIPDNYVSAWALDERPLHWRNPRGLPNGGLQAYPEGPSVTMASAASYTRWGSATVTLRGAGCAMYLNNATWANPTVLVNT